MTIKHHVNRMKDRLPFKTEFMSGEDEEHVIRVMMYFGSSIPAPRMFEELRWMGQELKESLDGG